MKRVFLALLALLSVSAIALAEDVYVSKPGKTPLKAEPKLDAPAKAPVGYGQKLTVKTRQPGWILVGIPGETVEGWISDKAVGTKRPGLDATPVDAAAARVAAAENTSTAGAIRGLDGRTADYAKMKQVPPESLTQLARLEGHAERQFKDPHSVDAKGVWQYPDATVPGRYEAAQGFSRDEMLHVPAPGSIKWVPKATPTPTPAAVASPAPAATPKP